MSAPTTSFFGMRCQGSPVTAECIYQLLLHAYPRAFRAEYGQEMLQLFRDQCRIGDESSIGFWTHLVWDLAQSAPALRVEAWRAHARESARTVGAIMRILAMLTVLLGLFGVANATVEGVAATRGGFGVIRLSAVSFGAVAGALLLVAGVGALRGTASARRAATRAAFGSLVVFLVARLLFGWMSIFSEVVALVLPLAMLASLHWRHGRDRSARPAQ